jgi:copper(I)-binding protein
MEPSRGVRRTLVGLVLLACVAAAGCSPAATTPVPTLAVADAWARPAPAGGDSAAYLTITNPAGADVLLSVQCTVASSTMLHQTATDTAGMTGMAMLADLAVPAGSTVRLQPGGTHVMLAGLNRALTVGESLELRMRFEHAGEIVVPAVVRPG